MFNDPLFKSIPDNVQIEKDIINTTVSVHRPLSFEVTAAGGCLLLFSLLFCGMAYGSVYFYSVSLVFGILLIIGVVFILVGISRKFGMKKILFSEDASFTIIDKKSLISKTSVYHFDFKKNETYWQIFSPANMDCRDSDLRANKNCRDFYLRIYDKRQDMKLTDLNQEEVEWLHKLIGRYVVYSGYGLAESSSDTANQEVEKARRAEIEREQRIQREREEKREKKKLENEEDEHNDWSANHAKDYRLASSYAEPYQASKHQENTIIDSVDSYDHDYDRYQSGKKKEKKKKSKKKK